MPNSKNAIGYFSDSPFYFNDFLQFSSFENMFFNLKRSKRGKRVLLTLKLCLLDVTTHLVGVAIPQLGVATYILGIAT